MGEFLDFYRIKHAAVKLIKCKPGVLAAKITGYRYDIMEDKTFVLSK